MASLWKPTVVKVVDEKKNCVGENISALVKYLLIEKMDDPISETYQETLQELKATVICFNSLNIFSLLAKNCIKNYCIACIWSLKLLYIFS